jgi:hypothetical protein
MWSTFRNCRKKYWWRYVRQLVRREKDRHMWLGGRIHECLVSFYQGHGWEEIETVLNQAYPARGGNPDERAQWHLGRAMMRAYVARYSQEPFKPIALEQQFSGEIVNPETGVASRSFTLDGKVDMLAEREGELWIVEHKTAATIDGTYIERLWTDFQISLYSKFIEESMGRPVAGVLYNILGKAGLEQGRGETEEQYQIRKAELEAKSKTGKPSTAKRRIAESDEDFEARLAAKYTDAGMLHREAIFISRDRIRMLETQLWELTQTMLDARRRDMWYQNEDQCFWYRRQCEYFPLCRAQDPENIIKMLYDHRPAHEELDAQPSEG